MESKISSRDAEFKDSDEYVFVEEYTEEPYLVTFFRDKVFDNFYLEVEVTSVTKPNKAAKFIYKLLNGVSEKAIGMIPGGDIVTSATKVVGSSLFELLKPEDKIQVIGRGLVLIELNNLTNNLNIPLKVPKDVKMTKVTYKSRIGIQKRKDKLIKKLRKKN